MESQNVLKKIRNARIEQKETLKSMAEKMGYKSISSYCKKELGVIPITLDDFFLICNILNKSPIYFLK